MTESDPRREAARAALRRLGITPIRLVRLEDGVYRVDTVTASYRLSLDHPGGPSLQPLRQD